MTQNKKSTRYFSNLQERDVAKLLGGKTTPNSGATNYRKGDVTYNENRDNTWLFECKTCMTNKQSFSIKKDWLRGIKEDAKQQGKLNYALVFNFGPKQENYYILSEDKFRQIFGEANED